MTPRSKRRVSARGDGARLREEILQAAIGLAETLNDPADVSLRAVAREVGIAATSVYLHFDSVNALLDAVRSQLWTKFADSAAASVVRSAPTTPAEGIRALLQAYIDFGAESPGAYKVLFSSAWRAVVADPPTRGQSEALGISHFMPVVEAFVPLCATRDQAFLLAVQLWCSAHGIVTLRLTRGAFDWPEIGAQIDQLAAMLVSAATSTQT